MIRTASLKIVLIFLYCSLIFSKNVGYAASTTTGAELQENKAPAMSPREIEDEIGSDAIKVKSFTEEDTKELGEDQETPPESKFPVPVQEIVPLTNVPSDRMKWSLAVVDAVNPYFSQPYKDASDKTSEFYSLKCSDGQVVYRPNHSLAHGLRQAYLAVDSVVLLTNLKEEDARNLGEQGSKLQGWIKNKSKDRNFLKKIEFANAFQRTGRQSETSRGENKDKYEAYLTADQENFQKNAQQYIGKDNLFRDEEEVEVYKQAIVKKFDKMEPGISEDVYFLSKIFYAAHLLDLRRLPRFSKTQIWQEVSSQLFGTATPNEWEKQLISTLWDRSGDYLSATGDRDMDDPKKSSWDVQVFCKQAHNPELLVQALQLARIKPETRLFQSILSHTQIMRQLKDRHKEERKLEATQSHKELEEAPYTASEAYLKLLLGKDYQEIPEETKEEKARDIIMLNVKAFLAAPKRVKDFTEKVMTFLPRIENPDERYLNILVDCMMEERRNRGKIVLYHATEPEIGFIYDVYTQLRNQLRMEGSNDISALRAIDKEFISLNRDAQQNQEEGKRANVVDFMLKFKGISDASQKYQDMGLSTNLSLFGSDQQKSSDTYNMFYLNKDEPISVAPVNGPKFFEHIEALTGIPITYDHYKPIMQRHIKGCEDKGACRAGNGRLIQVFIDPDVLTDMTYLSAIRGAPVLKEGKTSSLATPVTLLRIDPDKFIEYLKGTSAEKLGDVPSSAWRLSDLALHDLQVRLFMRPDLMFDKRFTTIKSYWRLGPPGKEYYKQISQLVNQGLVTWLQKGAPAHPDAFDPSTVKLKEFVQEVYQGTTGAKAAAASELPLERQFLDLLLEGRETAATLFEDRYKDLLGKKFIIQPDRDGKGGGQYSLRKLIKMYPFLPVVKVAFEKSIFEGGNLAYQVTALLEDESRRSALLEKLPTFEDPQETCRLFLEHFKETSKYWAIELLQAINALNNDEAVIKISKPLLEPFQKQSIDSDIAELIKGVAKIPEEKRQKVITDTLSLINFPKVTRYDFITAAENIQKILVIVWKMQGVDPKQREYIWSIAQQMPDTNWDDRIKIMKFMQGVDPKQREYIWSIAQQMGPVTTSFPDTSWDVRIKVMEFMQGADPKQRDYIWSTAQKMSPYDNWDVRIEVMSLLQNITWVPDEQRAFGWISVPFDAQDVVNYAKTKPKWYDMEFFGSEAGTHLITEVIKKLNAHMVPKDDFGSLSLLYNRRNPEDEDNKFLIASYISQLKARTHRLKK